MVKDYQPKIVKPTEAEKPKCKLVGQDGNIFNLGAIVSRALKNAGRHKEAIEIVGRMFSAGSYAEALVIIQEYVDTE